jgi:hypothetical protein
MNTLSTKSAYIVYGNHGHSPTQLEDYHTYLTQALEPLGYQVLLTADPIPGEFNILIEFFDGKFVKRIQRAAQTPGTRLIVIATEFITGDTFNDFWYGRTRKTYRQGRAPGWVKFLVDRIAPVLFPTALRALVLELFPDSYTGAREIYYKTFGNPSRSTYHLNEYWSARYTHFQHVVPLCEAVWCVSPHQMDAYVALYGSTLVKLMPLVSWSKDCSNPLQGKLERDIDFLFTGSVTPYREKVLGELSDRGYRVMVGTTTWPRYMRDHFVARTKVCLQIRQDTGWMYPSIMRYHHLLCSGSLVVAEKATETCLQEDFMTVAPEVDFLEACVAAVKAGNFFDLGQEASRKYFIASDAGRREFAQLLSHPSESQSVLESALDG